METSDRMHAPAVAWMVGIVAWLVPGGGHILVGRWGRGLLLGGTVGLMFLIGLRLGGHLFGFAGQEGTNALLQIPPAIANMGSGLLYLICWLLNRGFGEGADLASSPTFEYGNTFLLVAGLLNYLVMLDAFDLAAGRKR
ncbi:MAG TPA: DUF6677 family protein [Pyrinomonadaceae bacterium]|nr:DUF6677 family protein [Pyrinomonadaceae bacterium]